MKPDSRPSHQLPGPDDAETGLPGFRSWRAVYFLVLGSFALWVVFLVGLERLFA
jgi:hypothetical protein